jgi:hypothetical protein
MQKEQRRSHRIMFSIPVGIRGVDEQGLAFEALGRTITVNRHGARVQLSHPLKVGQVLQVINQANDEEGSFRVIGPTAPQFDQVSEWGIESVQGDKNIWDIQFPPLEEDVDAHVLLECRRCNSLALQSLSLVEVEVLETAGLLSKPCVRCGSTTPWGYSQRAFSVEIRTYQAAVAGVTGAAPAIPSERRKSPRKPSQLPVRVRDYYGETEITKTENISQEGFCFSSSRKYLVGQGIVVICPYDRENERPEVRAHIVREDRGGEGDRRLYGVRYDQLPG